MSAEGLHPWVWKAAANLWDDQYYKSAVLEAANAVELRTRREVGVEKFSGRDLYAQAFGIDPQGLPKRLRIVGLDVGTDAWKSAQEGAKFLVMGCSVGIRNWAARSTDKDVPEQEALGYLAALSVWPGGLTLRRLRPGMWRKRDPIVAHVVGFCSSWFGFGFDEPDTGLGEAVEAHVADDRRLRWGRFPRRWSSS